MPTTSDNLEEELIKVVRTLEDLQQKYLNLLENDDSTDISDDPGEALNSYKILSQKMLDWIAECENITRSIFYIFLNIGFICFLVE